MSKRKAEAALHFWRNYVAILEWLHSNSIKVRLHRCETTAILHECMLPLVQVVSHPYLKFCSYFVTAALSILLIIFYRIWVQYTTPQVKINLIAVPQFNSWCRDSNLSTATNHNANRVKYEQTLRWMEDRASSIFWVCLLHVYLSV